MPSKPKVRASSGTMGTTRSLMAFSLSRAEIKRTITIVVDCSLPPEPAKTESKTDNSGICKASLSLRRAGK